MIDVIVRTSFTPPVTVTLGPQGGASTPADETSKGTVDTIMGIVRPSIEWQGMRIEPYGPPGDWRVPLAIVVGLALIGVVAVVRGIK